MKLLRFLHEYFMQQGKIFFHKQRICGEDSFSCIVINEHDVGGAAKNLLIEPVSFFKGVEVPMPVYGVVECGIDAFLPGCYKDCVEAEAFGESCRYDVADDQGIGS